MATLHRPRQKAMPTVRHLIPQGRRRARDTSSTRSKPPPTTAQASGVDLSSDSTFAQRSAGIQQHSSRGRYASWISLRSRRIHAPWRWCMAAIASRCGPDAFTTRRNQAPIKARVIPGVAIEEAKCNAIIWRIRRPLDAHQFGPRLCQSAHRGTSPASTAAQNSRYSRHRHAV